jgi:hypothetical protein
MPAGATLLADSALAGLVLLIYVSLPAGIQFSADFLKSITLLN